VDDGVHDASHCENTANDGADVDEELGEVLAGVRVVDCHGADTVIEDQNVFNAVLVLVMDGKLEDLRSQHVAKAEVRLKYGRYSVEGKHTPHIFALLLISGEAIEWVLNVGVREAAFDLGKIVKVAEGQVVDLVRIVQTLALRSEHLDDVSESVVTNVEVARHAVHFDEPLESATLASLQFLLNALQELFARCLLFIYVFD
jgi:hypothetical protein